MVDVIDDTVKLGIEFPEEKKFPWWILLLIPLIIITKKENGKK
jgi:hypothetical protein